MMHPLPWRDWLVRTCVALMTSGVSGIALAEWTLNLGFHNPPGSSLGVNFLYGGFSKPDWGGSTPRLKRIKPPLPIKRRKQGN